MLARLVVASIALAVPLLLPARGSAQIEIAARAATITVGGRFQMQYAHSSVDAANNDFFVRRARLMADVRVNDFLSGRVQTDFAGGGAELKDGYMMLDFSDAFALTLGRFKRPFDLFELSSSTDLSLIERDGRIEGLSGACAGVGSVCSYSRFTEALGYSDRDLGVRISGSSGALGYQAALTNGTGGETDENDRKSASGRITWAATEQVRVSGQVGLHDYEDPIGAATAVAFGGDVEVGTWRDGLHVQAAVVTGDNWQALDPQLDPATFLAWQGVLTYYHPLEGERIAAVEPLARVSWGDPSLDADDDSGILLTPGVMLYVVGRNKIGLNLDYYAPQTGASELSLKLQSFLYF